MLLLGEKVQRAAGLLYLCAGGSSGQLCQIYAAMTVSDELMAPVNLAPAPVLGECPEHRDVWRARNVRPAGVEGVETPMNRCSSGATVKAIMRTGTPSDPALNRIER